MNALPIYAPATPAPQPAMLGLGLTRTREVGAADQLCRHDLSSRRTLRSSLTARTAESEAGRVGGRATGS